MIRYVFIFILAAISLDCKGDGRVYFHDHIAVVKNNCIEHKKEKYYSCKKGFSPKITEKNKKHHCKCVKTPKEVW